MTVSNLLQRFSKAVEKSDILKGFLIGGASVIGTEGAVFIGKRAIKKKLKKGKE